MRTALHANIYRRAMLAGAIIATASCTDLTPPNDPIPPTPGPVISVDKFEYSWRTDSLVRYSVANPQGVDLYLACPELDWQTYRNGWHFISGQVSCPADFMDYSSRIAPGATYSGTLPLTNDIIPQSGFYRVVFDLYKDPDLMHQWPLAGRVTHAFRVGP